MSDTEGRHSGEPGPEELDEIEAGIERTREDLAETVDELTARLDVKTRARERVAQAREDALLRLQTLRYRVVDNRGRPTPVALGAVGVVATGAGLVAVLLWRRQRAARRRSWWRR